MPLRDHFHSKKKKESIADPSLYDQDAPEIPTFIRSDSHTYEVLTPPSVHSFAEIESLDGQAEVDHRRSSLFKPRSMSDSTAPSTFQVDGPVETTSRRPSNSFHRSQSGSVASTVIIPPPAVSTSAKVDEPAGESGARSHVRSSHSRGGSASSSGSTLPFPKIPTSSQIDGPAETGSGFRSRLGSTASSAPIQLSGTPPNTKLDGPAAPGSRRLSIFHSRSRSSSTASSATAPVSGERPPNPKRLSYRLHLSRARSSTHLPQDLPDIAPIVAIEGCAKDGEVDQRKATMEAQWEERATQLATFNERGLERNGAGAAAPGVSPARQSLQVSTKHGNDNIQEAIRLHEAGELKESTSMFGRLADVEGENNALSQVLYGLALRHGWGIEPNAGLAVTYLSAAASNAAAIETQALQAGLKKGGAAKGELVLAIYELANCFRNGWGVEKDAVAAKQYYETAANLGDTDAMNEVGECYLNGKGCKRDKYLAAKYYRLAETCGSRTLGNSWIWKAKYDPK